MGTILLVEDDYSNRLFFQEYLLYKKYTCYTATQGVEALTILQEHHIHLIITDIDMPIMDGFQFLIALQEHPSFQKIPVLIMTGHLTEEVKQLASQEQVKGILGKPVMLEELSLAIDRILSR